MAISSFGTLLQIGDGATPTEGFTTIAEVLDIGGPELTLEREDSTHHGSTGGWVEKIATVLDAGEVPFDIQYNLVGATHNASTGLIADMVARTLRNFKLIFPDTGATTWTFAAYVAKVGPSMPVKGKLTASIILDISGAPTLA